MHTQLNKAGAAILHIRKEGAGEGKNQTGISQGCPTSKTDEFAKFAGRRTGDTVFFSPWQQRSRIWA